MQAAFSEGCGYVTFYRQQIDPKFHGLRYARGEHRLFRFIVRWLNARGFDLVRKRAQLDGHTIGDQHQPYVRCRNHSQQHLDPTTCSLQVLCRSARLYWSEGDTEMTKFEIKRFRSQRGHEGPGFYCVLWVDGVKGAEAIDQGDGGMVHWSWFDQEAKRKFDEYVASLPEREMGWSSASRP